MKTVGGKEEGVLFLVEGDKSVQGSVNVEYLE